MGPSAVRVAGLEARLEAIGHVVEDAGNIAVAIPEQKKAGAANFKYLKEITATCTKSADMVLKTLEAGKVPLILGGDHSVAVGTVSGVAEFYRRKNQKNKLSSTVSTMLTMITKCLLRSQDAACLSPRRTRKTRGPGQGRRGCLRAGRLSPQRTPTLRTVRR